jgi:hypothetical protein
VRLAEQAGITPDPWQAEVLRSGALRVLLLERVRLFDVVADAL